MSNQNLAQENPTNSEKLSAGADNYNSITYENRDSKSISGEPATSGHNLKKSSQLHEMMFDSEPDEIDDLIDHGSNWFQVQISEVQNYDKNSILNVLLPAVSPEVITAYYWRTIEDCVYFYVDNIIVARALLSADQKLKLPDGSKITIDVINNTPSVKYDSTFYNQTKMALQKRFSPINKSLDLTKFYSDEFLRDIYADLSEDFLLMEIIDIIASMMPDLEMLILNNNGIENLEDLLMLAVQLQGVKILHIANNKIKDVNMLELLGPTSVVDLVLTGNPIIDSFNDHSTYISEVRKKVPKLCQLDGNDLPPQMDSEKSVPKSVEELQSDLNKKIPRFKPFHTLEEPDDERKQELIDMLSRTTNMNSAHSKRFLSASVVKWDLERAVYCFGQLKKSNDIPKSAFAK